MNTAVVLVADDDAAIRRSLERGLRLSGFTVVLAEDGPGALAQVDARPPTCSSWTCPCRG